MTSTDWTGHVAVVTGAGGGIGRAIAERFAEVGAEVVIAEVNAEAGQRAAAELQAKYGKGLAVTTNVARDADCRALIEATVAAYGHVDTLVNNAGVNFVKPTLAMTEADWDRVVDVDLKGTFLCCRYALEAMVPRGRGSIVNIASVHTKATLPEAAPYAASKGGVQMLTCALANEFARHGIRVNAVSPGLTDTPIWQDIQAAAEDVEEARQHWFDNIPMGRVGTAREVANVVLFLASDEASYTTGANLVTDGGMTAQLVSRERYASKPLEGNVRQ